jgi:uncharacterized protein (DUF58 family)
VKAASLRSWPLVRALVRGYEDHLTTRGRYLLWTALVLGVAGMDTRRTQIHMLFAGAAALLVVAAFVEGAPRPRARLECPWPSRMTAGTALTLRARIVAERVHHHLQLSFRRPVRAGGRVTITPPETFLAVAPGAPAEVAVTLRADRRGRYELRGPTLRRTDPLRLAASGGVSGPSQTLLVYPRYFSLDSFPIPLGRRYQPGGIPLSSSLGDAIEFVGTRDYREGDPVRAIHWRSWARRGAPVVKEYHEEYFCRIALVLDTFLPRRPRAAQEAAFEAAISVVASIADFFSRSEYVVDILAAGPDLYEVSAGRSLAYLDNILDVLACLEPCRETPFATVGPPLFEKLAQITSVIAVLQDWDEPRERFLREVRALGTPVRALVVHEGETSLDWARAAGAVGDISVMAPADVERALTAGRAAAAAAS